VRRKIKKIFSRRIILLTGFTLFSFFCFSQYSFQRFDSIPVMENSQWLPNPWAGGLNNPQFSAIDLDGDGKKDLFIYDRSSDKIFTFLNKGQTGEVKYVYDSYYESFFPPLHNWVLLVDYNKDGKEDIFTSATYNGKIGIAVYSNESDASGLKFKRMDPPLMLADNNLMYASQWDIPAISDIDSDGDIDIVTFDIAGNFMLMFRNLSVENYGNSDSLYFTLYDKCWGKFMENFGNCTVTLDTCPQPIMRKESQPDGPQGHAGSTILALETNGDKAKELLIGDITCNSMYLLNNIGDSLDAKMSSVCPVYPSPDSIWIYYFPAAFLLDVNNDGLNDLIVAPNALNISEYFKGCWYYQNRGTNTVPNFVFQTKSFLQDQMIEVSESSHPVFFDYNGDGLPDLLIGNYHYFKSTGYNPSEIALYQNIGTRSSPTFKLITRDFAGISSLGLQAVFPTFGDLDSDGDEDMIIGDETGRLYYFENTAGKGNPANFILRQPNYENIDVGQYAAPQLVDVNRDGKLDLLIGERDGNLNYYENTGTPEIAAFTLVTDSFGKVMVNKSGNITGYSVPFLTQLTDSCHYSLFVGSESGQLFLYTNIDNNLNGTFTTLDTNFSGIYTGNKSSAFGSDINGDGTIDLAVGNLGGGVSIFLNKGKAASACYEELPFSIDIYPVPAVGTLTISIPGTNSSDVTGISIYNILGQQSFFGEFQSGSNKTIASIPLANFAAGIYFCRVNTAKGQECRKIIIMK